MLVLLLLMPDSTAAYLCLQVPSENMDHLPEPAIELWHKVVPLGMIFFCASFNLTILQVGPGCRSAESREGYMGARWWWPPCY